MAKGTAIITGATKGIGKATAYYFLQQGYNLGICARTAEDLEALRAQWQAEFPEQRVLAFTADCADNEQVRAFAATCLSHFGHIDVLVNNAGIFLPGTVLEEDEDKSLREQMEVNCFAAFTMSKIIGNAMKKQQYGHIINVCSIAGLQAYAGGSSYSISKYAMLGMSDNFREALRPFKVKVTAICPGPTQSYSWEGSGVDMERLMPASDIARIIYECSQTSWNTCVDRISITPVQAM